MDRVQPRPDSNYRYYCDNDPMDMAGNTRWTLRPDPAPWQRTLNYTPQKFRNWRQEPYQEWEDVTNGVSEAQLA